MRLVNYVKAGRRCLGARMGDAIVDLTAAGLPDSTDALLAMGADGLRKAKDAAGKGGATTPFVQAKLLAPVINPSKAIAVRSEEHKSELQSLMRNQYADFGL